MINAIRNCLLNEKMPAGTAVPPWDCYMPDNFKPIILNSTLHAVQQNFIPSKDDWWAKTYKTAMLLSIVLTYRYREYISYPDTRIIPNPNKIFSFDFGSYLTPLNAAATVATSAAIVKPDWVAESPKVFRSWSVSYVTGSAFEVISGGISKVVDYDDGIVLAEDVIFKVSLDGLTSGALWAINSYTRQPSYLSNCAINCGNIAGSVIDSLFTVESPDQQDLTTFRRWYDNSKYGDDRIAAIILAYVRKYYALYNTLN